MIIKASGHQNVVVIDAKGMTIRAKATANVDTKERAIALPQIRQTIQFQRTIQYQKIIQFQRITPSLILQEVEM